MLLPVDVREHAAWWESTSSRRTCTPNCAAAAASFPAKVAQKLVIYLCLGGVAAAPVVVL